MAVRRWVWVLPFLLLTTSCIRGGAALGVAALAGWAIASSSQHHEPETVYVDRVVVVHEPAPAPAAPAPPPAPPPPPPPSRARAFDVTGARVALEQSGVAECREEGVPRGYVHARVRFANSGTVAGVVIDAPAGLSSQAVTCIGDRITAAMAPPFDGDTSP
jgi:hypothetical protein